MDDRISDSSITRMARIPIRVSRASLRCRSLKLNEFLSWTSETVIAFDQSASAPLSICIGDRVIGEGQAVKVGSKIGLRCLRIGGEQTAKN